MEEREEDGMKKNERGVKRGQTWRNGEERMRRSGKVSDIKRREGEERKMKVIGNGNPRKREREGEGEGE